MMRKRIYRSVDDKVIGGVCGGLGDHFNIDPTWIRVLFVLGIFADGVGLLAYLIAWIVIPRQTEVLGETSATVGDAAAQAYVKGQTTPAAGTPERGRGFLPGIILVILGLVFLFDRFFYWFHFEQIWPLLLIGIGVILIYRAVTPKEKSAEAGVHPSGTVEVENGGQ